MHRGYTIRWRKRWDKGYHKDPLLWVMMDWFIDHANHEDSEEFLIHYGNVKLKRGQHLFGIPSMARYFCVSEKRIRNRLKILEKIEFLAIQRTNRYSIATITNYSKYQDKEKRKGKLTGRSREEAGKKQGRSGATHNTLKYISKELIIHLNKISGRRFTVEANIDYVMPRLQDGFTKEQCIEVIEKKWGDSDFNKKYFCPETLFRKSKFEKYLNEDINTGGAPCNSQGKALTTEQIAEQQWKNRKRK